MLDSEEVDAGMESVEWSVCSCCDGRAVAGTVVLSACTAAGLAYNTRASDSRLLVITTQHPSVLKAAGASIRSFLLEVGYNILEDKGV